MLYDLLARFAASCSHSGSFFGFPTWYKYLSPHDVVVISNGAGVTTCEVNFGISDIPLVGLALVDIALRIAALIAVGYIIYGGIQFVIAQGETDKTKRARQTVINALVGLALAMVSVGIVAFIGSKVAV